MISLTVTSTKFPLLNYSFKVHSHRAKAKAKIFSDVCNLNLRSFSLSFGVNGTLTMFILFNYRFNFFALVICDFTIKPWFYWPGPS